MINNKKVGLIIPVRYNSERLPGKVLMEISGKKVIERIILRAGMSNYIDKIILAVSEESADKLESWYVAYQDSRHSPDLNLHLYIGSHENIGQRTLEAAIEYDIDIIVDTSQDCVFIDSSLIDSLIERIIDYKADYASNIIVRSYPDGFDLQVYTREIYEKVINSGYAKKEWTGWNIFYAREKIYPKPRFYNLMAKPWHYYPDWHLCLDTEDDFKLISHIYEHTTDLENYSGIISYLKQHPELLLINDSVIPTELEQELI